MYTYSQQSAQQSQSNSTALSATSNDVKKTSGAVTIVKLNAQATSLEVHKPFIAQSELTVTPKSKVINSNSSSSYVVRPTTPSHPNHTAHVVTIHTSSSSSSSASTANPVSAANAPSSSNHIGSPTGTTAGNTTTSHSATTSNGGGVGYTRRAKLGDSRSTGRLHSAGNTHRSMTRLNIAGTLQV